MYLEPKIRSSKATLVYSQIEYVRNNVPLLEEPELIEGLLVVLDSTEGLLRSLDIKTAIVEILPALELIHSIFKQWVTTDKVVPVIYPYKEDASILKDILKALHTAHTTLIELAYWYI